VDQRQRRIREVGGRWYRRLTMELRENTDKEWICKTLPGRKIIVCKNIKQHEKVM
jgi:hypothetical protein